MRVSRLLVVVLSLAALAAAGVGANLYLLGLTGDTGEPVGRLSPRAVFPAPKATTPPGTTQSGPAAPTPGDDRARGERQPDD